MGDRDSLDHLVAGEGTSGRYGDYQGLIYLSLPLCCQLLMDFFCSRGASFKAYTVKPSKQNLTKKDKCTENMIPKFLGPERDMNSVSYWPLE